MRAAIVLRSAVTAIAALLHISGNADAQMREIDMNALALDWSRGRYLSPVICETDGELTRGGRGILIEPGPRHILPPVNRLSFSDLEVPGASRCFDELGRAQPNVIGSVQFRHLSRSRYDTAQRDFRAALRRDKGFEFSIAGGTLSLQTVGEDEVREVAFRGGTAALHLLGPGSDDARALGDLHGLRKLLLELEAPDGTKLRFPLLMTELR